MAEKRRFMKFFTSTKLFSELFLRIDPFNYKVSSAGEIFFRVTRPDYILRQNIESAMLCWHLATEP